MLADFYARPFAHRGLHGPGATENSMASMLAAVEAGYGIELDVQPRGDGTPMVFHDYTVDRLTAAKGAINGMSAAEVAALLLPCGGAIPTLAAVLSAVAGRVPILVELKDQDGAYGPDIGALEREVAALAGPYVAQHGTQSLAVMSFNPHSAGWFTAHAPELLRGIVSYDYADEDLPEEQKTALAECRDFQTVAADFISYGAGSFPAAAIARYRAEGVPVITWTIRSEEAAVAALRHCDQITFESYHPA